MALDEKTLYTVIRSGTDKNWVVMKVDLIKRSIVWQTRFESLSIIPYMDSMENYKD